MKKRVINLIFLVLCTAVCLFGEVSKPGGIRGTVVDSHTQQPLIGVNILVMDTEWGAATDENGSFFISGIRPGSYHIRFQMIGYELQTKLNVSVSPGRDLILNIGLVQTVLEIGDVVVTADFFKKAKDAVISDRSVDFTEIINDPGSSMDIQRMMQSLPSVVSASDQYNEIVVRGGAPGENLFIMDHIEIPNPNHFGEIGSGGGPIGLLNPLFINEVDFYAGSFPARYGNKTSSVMDVQLREGNRQNFEGVLDMGMSGVGGMAEGPIAKGKGSYLLSYHKSYLDLIVSGIGLTAVPKYYNTQGKVVWDLTKRHKLIWNGVYGNDRIDIVDEDAKSSRGAENVKVRGSEYATGLSWKALWNPNLYSLVTLYLVGNTVGYDGTHDNGVAYFKTDLTETETALKGDFVYRIDDTKEITTGFSLKNLVGDGISWADADTVFAYGYFVNGGSNYVELHDWPFAGTIDSSIILDTLSIGDRWKMDKTIRTNRVGVHFQYKWTPLKSLTIIAGVRYDYFAYTGFGGISPRLGISYSITPVTKINAGYGRNYQSPIYTDLAVNSLNKSLKDKYTDQIVLGVEHFFARDIRATFEVYSRKYHDIPIDLSATTPDSMDDSDNHFANEGKGHVEGFELFLQKKLFDRFHGLLSYSGYVAKREDPRYPGTEYNASFDYRNVLTVVLGYREKLMNRPWYMSIRDKGWFKAVAWILPLGDEVEVSVRWRYLGGKPYTKNSYDPYTKRWYTSANQPYNTERFPDYHRLDVQLNSRSILKNVNLVTYINIQNIYDRANVWDYQYNSDGTREKIYQYRIMPVGGFIIEF